MATPIAITFTVKDKKGLPSEILVNVPSGTTLTDAVTFAGALAPLVYPLVTGLVTQVAVTAYVGLGVDSNNLAAADNSDVQEKALFQFRTSIPNGNFLKSIFLPTFDEALFVAGSKLVDLADTDVAAFVTAIVTGIAGVAGATSHDEDIAYLDVAREAWGKYRSSAT